MAQVAAVNATPSSVILTIDGQPHHVRAWSTSGAPLIVSRATGYLVGIKEAESVLVTEGPPARARTWPAQNEPTSAPHSAPQGQDDEPPTLAE